jgi:CubicO group peptidase (beta-lactamase class C family)
MARTPTIAGTRATRLDEYVRAAMKNQHIPGLAVAVIKNGKVVKAKGYGLANIELDVPVTPRTVFKLCSVSKQFIAAGMMLLVEENRVELDDPIARHLDGTPDTWSDITVRHLLTMTSGLPPESPAWSPLQEATEEEILLGAHDVPLLFAPGEKGEYCNLGYFLLAQIIHRTSGRPWGEFFHERIFALLGMNDTRITTEIEITPNRAAGYDWQENTFRNAAPILTVRPSGAFLSTVMDMVKWDTSLSERKLLRRSTLDQMWAAVTLMNGTNYPYGFGWQVEEIDGRKVVRHGGGMPGFRTHSIRFLQDHVTVIVLANGSEAMPDSIAVEVARNYLKTKKSITEPLSS